MKILYQNKNKINTRDVCCQILANDSNSLVIPGSVVWARTDDQMWWPVEVYVVLSCHVACFCHNLSASFVTE
ncbi:hypothetical protein Fmac_027552 [Flemingia macrophylla]|uniref:PWWP domain-containing protein n=1 Tax=Flemingia macrophylla TaxID=520843 RepID=A0ABD1LI17_9FABA